MQLCKGKLVLTALCNHFLRHAFSWVLFNSGMSNSFYIVVHFEKEVQFQQYISFFVFLFYMIKKLTFFFFLAHCADCHVIINWKIYCLKKKNHKFLSL